MATKIDNCSCEHKYQDRKFGAGKRVFNLMKQNDKSLDKWRCTVCSKEK